MDDKKKVMEDDAKAQILKEKEMRVESISKKEVIAILSKEFGRQPKDVEDALTKRHTHIKEA